VHDNVIIDTHTLMVGFTALVFLCVSISSSFCENKPLRRSLNCKSVYYPLLHRLLIKTYTGMCCFFATTGDRLQLQNGMVFVIANFNFTLSHHRCALVYIVLTPAH